MNVQFHVWLPEDSIRIERRIHRHHRESQRAKLGPKNTTAWCFFTWSFQWWRDQQMIGDHQPVELNWLVVYLPLWKIWKSNGPIIPNLWKYKKCSKPPTSQHRPGSESLDVQCNNSSKRCPPDPSEIFGHNRGLFVRAVHAYAGGGWLQHQPPEKRISGGSSSQKGVKVKTILTISNEKSGDFISATSWQIREIHPLQHSFMAPDFSLSSTASWCNWRSKPCSCCKIYLTLSKHLFICCQPSSFFGGWSVSSSFVGELFILPIFVA